MSLNSHAISNLILHLTMIQSSRCHHPSDGSWKSSVNRSQWHMPPILHWDWRSSWTHNAWSRIPSMKGRCIDTSCASKIVIPLTSMHFVASPPSVLPAVHKSRFIRISSFLIFQLPLRSISIFPTFWLTPIILTFVIVSTIGYCFRVTTLGLFPAFPTSTYECLN